MKYCYNCGRELKDNEQCDCINIKLSDEFIEEIHRNSNDIYSNDVVQDLIKNKIIESEKQLEKTVSTLKELEESMNKFNHVKATTKILNHEELNHRNKLDKVDVGLLDKDTVWNTDERYYEVLDEVDKD